MKARAAAGIRSLRDGALNARIGAAAMPLGGSAEAAEALREMGREDLAQVVGSLSLAPVS